MKSMKHTLTVVTTLGMFAAPIYADNAEKALESAQTTLYDIMDKDITTVQFEAGSATVSDAERLELRALVQSIRDDSKIENIIVAAWSDKDYPAQGKNLSKRDRELAEKRSENVKKVLDQLGAKDIDTYSMAEHPSWIAKVFNTDDAAIKDSIKGKQIEDRTTASIAKTLKAEGGPSTIVVLVKREMNAKTTVN